MRNMTKRRRALMISSANKSVLPEEFQEVEWLMGSGTQWCYLPYGYGLGLDSDNHFYGIKGDLEFLNGTGYAKIAISAERGRDPQIDRWLIRGSYGGLTEGYYPYYGDTISVSSSDELTKHFEINKTSMIINNNVLQNPNYPNNSYIQPYIQVGCFTGTGDNRIIENSNVLIKGIKLTIDGAVYAEFIPCYRKSDSKAGLFYWIDYSQGTSGFITNRGSGSDFLVGPDV